MSKRRKQLAAIALICLVAAPARSQQPFVTVDADVTDKGKLFFEFINEYDLLQRSAFPALRQNTATFTLTYGLLDGVEVSVGAPVITIYNTRGSSPRSVSGVGDASVAVKYNFLREREGSRRPALAVGLGVEFPTGSTDKGIGSGLYDYYLNGILQKSLTGRTKLRLNGGVTFAGNQTTGALGIRARGTVFNGGGSLVREFTDRLTLGAEVTGALTRNFDLSRGQLQTQVGGKYALRENLSLDFGVIGGRFAASPRVGAQVGLSMAF